MPPSLLSSEARFNKLSELLAAEMNFDCNNERLLSMEDPPFPIFSDISLDSYVRKLAIYSQVIGFSVVRSGKRTRSNSLLSNADTQQGSKTPRLSTSASDIGDNSQETHSPTPVLCEIQSASPRVGENKQRDVEQNEVDTMLAYYLKYIKLIMLIIWLGILALDTGMRP